MQRNSWSSWDEYLNVSSSDKLEESNEKFVPQSDVMKLKLEDKNLFGFCPEYEDFYLVICQICGKSLKPQSLMSHIELRHSKNNLCKLSVSESLQDSLISNPTSNCSNENSKSNDDNVSKDNSIYALSGSREKYKVMSNKKQNVYVQPYLRSSSEIYCQNKNTNKFASFNLSSDTDETVSIKPKNDYSESLRNGVCVPKEISCQKNVGKLKPFIPSPDMFQTTLTRHIASQNDCSDEVYVTKESSLATSSSTCDSQTSMTVFLHHSFVMPNIKLCDIKDERSSHHQSVTCKTLPNTTFLAQVLPVKRGRPSIRSLRQSSQVHQNSGKVNNWSGIHDNSNLALNGVSYSAWNQHTSHFHPLPHSVPIGNSGQMDSFNCSELTKRFGDIESQVLIHNAAMGT